MNEHCEQQFHYNPHQTVQHHIPNIWAIFPEPVSPTNNRLAADPSMTQWIPNIWNTSPERAWAKSQWIKRWSTVSPFLQHIQHQFANGKPLLVRLSNVRILPKAAVNIKNTTLLGLQGGNWHLKLEKFFSTPLGNINKVISIRSQAKPFVRPIKKFRINILYQDFAYVTLE